MKNQRLLLGAIVLLMFTCSALRTLHAQDGMPIGWNRGGSKPANYEMTADTAVKHGGQASGCLQFVAQQADGFATLMQNFKAEAYRGKRLRMAAWVKTEKLDDRAQLWLRLDALKGMPGFDNMGNRPIKGVNDWRRYELVLDVPSEAVNIAFGVMAFGTGRVWVDDFAFDVVGNEVAETDQRTPEQRKQEVDNSWLSQSKLSATPANLDFEGGAQPVRQPVAVNPKIFDDYTGYYQSRSQIVEVTKAGDSLLLGGFVDGTAKVFWLSDTEFFVKTLPGSWRFVRGAQGKVTEMFANVGGVEDHARRIDVASAKARGAQIMAAAYQAKGGLDKLKAVHNVWHDGVRTQAGQPSANFDLYLSDASQFFSETRNSEGKVTGKSGSDGKTGWNFDGKESRELDANQVANARLNRQLIWLEFTLQPFAGKTLEPLALDDAEYNGKPVEVVAALIGGDKYMLSFDKQSHLLRRITFTGNGNFSDYSYDDYFDVNGLQMAGTAYIGGGGAKRKIAISHYKINAGIEASKLTPAAASPEAQIILKQEEAFRLARLTNNVEVIEQLMSEDYIGTNQYGEYRNKAAFKLLYQPGNFKLEVFTIDHTQVTLSGDTAIVSGAQTEKVSSEAAQSHLFTHVWVKRDGRWRLLVNTQFLDPNRK